jgi:hypothetical protein
MMRDIHKLVVLHMEIKQFEQETALGNKGMELCRRAFIHAFGLFRVFVCVQRLILPHIIRLLVSLCLFLL